ncbi:hypothetical protein BU23DRAFT_562684 [Bimuria novae-zelandiae CBS 107.79]|uniref:Uncharacterized protein n=1 Tax=Bimuria novae-zelandiae CBS 107.79 TaxID=1447943 RepID=A0A6A5VZL7_9PLEO|nr:hypothetical protein BU23DRAFT_562684 [Bimuria novae-zelandiae CBS 107.79]
MDAYYSSPVSSRTQTQRTIARKPLPKEARLASCVLDLSQSRHSVASSQSFKVPIRPSLRFRNFVQRAVRMMRAGKGRSSPSYSKHVRKEKATREISNVEATDPTRASRKSPFPPSSFGLLSYPTPAIGLQVRNSFLYLPEWKQTCHYPEGEMQQWKIRDAPAARIHNVCELSAIPQLSQDYEDEPCSQIVDEIEDEPVSPVIDEIDDLLQFVEHWSICLLRCHLFRRRQAAGRTLLRKRVLRRLLKSGISMRSSLVRRSGWRRQWFTTPKW